MTSTFEMPDSLRKSKLSEILVCFQNRNCDQNLNTCKVQTGIGFYSNGIATIDKSMNLQIQIFSTAEQLISKFSKLENRPEFFLKVQNPFRERKFFKNSNKVIQCEQIWTFALHYIFEEQNKIVGVISKESNRQIANLISLDSASSLRDSFLEIVKKIAEDEQFEKFVDFCSNPESYLADFTRNIVILFLKKSQIDQVRDDLIRKIIVDFADNFTLKSRMENHGNELVNAAILEIAKKKVTPKNKERQHLLSDCFKEKELILRIEIFVNQSTACDSWQDARINELFRNEIIENVFLLILSNAFEVLSSTKFGAKDIEEVVKTIIQNTISTFKVQCPFAKYLHLDPNHTGHHVTDFHLSHGVAGEVACQQVFPSETGLELSCSNIQGDSSLIPFWKWFLCRFQSNLNVNKIPEDWKKVTKSEAIENLNLQAGPDLESLQSLTVEASKNSLTENGLKKYILFSALAIGCVGGLLFFAPSIKELLASLKSKASSIVTEHVILRK